MIGQRSGPADAIPDYADRPRGPVAGVVASRRGRPGRRPQPAGVDLAFLGILHSGAVGQGQQRRHGQHEPMAGDARRVRPPGLVPLPAQALDGPRIQYGAGFETHFDPEAQSVPTHPNRLRRMVRQYDPGLRLIGVPDHQQGATVFSRAFEGGSTADPRGIRLGNEGSGGQSPTALGAEGDVFRVSDVGMPAPPYQVRGRLWAWI